MILEPNKFVPPDEIDIYVNHVKEMFPSVDKAWLYAEFQRPATLSMIIDILFTNPSKVPKEKKPEKPKKLDPNAKEQKIVAINYFFEIAQVPSQTYITSTTQLLQDEFKQVRCQCFQAVMRLFNNHYAPTFKLIRDSLKAFINENPNELIRGGTIVPLLSFPAISNGIDNRRKPLNIHMNQTRRPRRRYPVHIPQELQAEIEWFNLHLDDDWFMMAPAGPSGTPGSSAGDFVKEDEETQLAQRRKLLLDEARLTGDSFECAICCDEYLFDEMKPCTEGHLFCQNCLRNHAQQVLYGQAKAQISCLESDCKASFSGEVLKSTLEETWLIKLDERMQEENINCADIENLVRCKYCNFAVVMDTPAEQNKVFTCPNPECEKSVCRLCNADWDEEHLGKRCEELETGNETSLRRKMEEKMAEAVIRTCFSCKAKLVKQEGCNKMTCRCGAKMCYICRQPNIDYGHFCQHVRNPGQKCQKCTSCYLWEDAQTVDRVALENLKKETEQEQQAAGLRQQRVGAEIDPVAPVANRQHHHNIRGGGGAVVRIQHHPQAPYQQPYANHFYGGVLIYENGVLQQQYPPAAAAGAYPQAAVAYPHAAEAMRGVEEMGQYAVRMAQQAGNHAARLAQQARDRAAHQIRVAQQARAVDDARRAIVRAEPRGVQARRQAMRAQRHAEMNMVGWQQAAPPHDDDGGSDDE